jgi:Arc/MetJ family transcription regulator
MLSDMARTMIDLDDALLERAAKELGTGTKKDTVHAALRAAVRQSAARRLIDRMAANTNGLDHEALANSMWDSGESARGSVVDPLG